jgi:YesN/AraC family two-component response regulator
MIRRPYVFSEDESAQNRRFHALLTESELTGWIHRLIRLVVRINNELSGLIHPYVGKTVAYLQAHYENTELSLQSVADALHVNTAYLGQLFRAQTGKYFNDYLSDVRMEISCTLLTDTSLRIREIAQKVGIPSQSYFNRLFKKKYLLTPMEYRQRYSELKGEGHPDTRPF